jgi:membrane dipeptidase
MSDNPRATAMATTRRDFLRRAVLAGAGLYAGPTLGLGRVRLFADDRLQHSSRAVELVEASQVIDMLGLLTLDWPRLEAWHRQPGAFREEDFRRLAASGIDVFHPAVEPNHPRPFDATRAWISDWTGFLRRESRYFRQISSSVDLERFPGDTRLGVLIGFQNSEHFRTLEDVALFHRMGQRVSQLTYNATNRLGGGCLAEHDRGLTAFGAEVVTEMNRLGMAIDVSHCGERTTLDAFEVSRRPVLVTHSNCHALARHPRCKSDQVLRAMARTGGVIGITGVRAFVRQGSPARLEDLLDHFDHVARLVGVEHVGLGTDTDPDTLDPLTGQIRAAYRIAGLNPSRRVYDLAEGLLRRGYSASDVTGVLGGNFRRALDEIWNAAVL